MIKLFRTLLNYKYFSIFDQKMFELEELETQLDEEFKSIIQPIGNQI
jgi:hypothetical protein